VLLREAIKRVAVLVPQVARLAFAAGYARISQVRRDLVRRSRDTAVAGDGDRGMLSVYSCGFMYAESQRPETTSQYKCTLAVP
jgi:hypothetical protein